MSAVRRGAVVLAVGGAVVLGVAGPASAHVEVTATPARALATDVTLTLHGEAESDSAGVTGVRIQLPSGLLAGDVGLAAGPGGWRLSGSGQVVTVTGPALPVGRDVDLRFRLRQLPAGEQLVLKTVQTYADGRQDGWVELPSASVPEPDNPAPVVPLAAAAPGATPVPRTTAPAPTTAAPAPSASASASAGSSAPAPVTAQARPADGDGAQEGAGNAEWLFGGVAAGVLILGGVVLALRRAANREL